MHYLKHNVSQQNKKQAFFSPPCVRLRSLITYPFVGKWKQRKGKQNFAIASYALLVNLIYRQGNLTTDLKRLT